MQKPQDKSRQSKMTGTRPTSAAKTMVHSSRTLHAMNIREIQNFLAKVNDRSQGRTKVPQPPDKLVCTPRKNDRSCIELESQFRRPVTPLQCPARDLKSREGSARGPAQAPAPIPLKIYEKEQRNGPLGAGLAQKLDGSGQDLALRSRNNGLAEKPKSRLPCAVTKYEAVISPLLSQRSQLPPSHLYYNPLPLDRHLPNDSLSPPPDVVGGTKTQPNQAQIQPFRLLHKDKGVTKLRRHIEAMLQPRPPIVQVSTLGKGLKGEPKSTYKLEEPRPPGWCGSKANKAKALNTPNNTSHLQRRETERNSHAQSHVADFLDCNQTEEHNSIDSTAQSSLGLLAVVFGDMMRLLGVVLQYIMRDCAIHS